jgi:AcrR family transcriptional regulator
MTGEANGPVKARILGIAADLFWNKGFAGTSTRELAEALNIQKASLYHHIRSKEDLLYDLSIRSLDLIKTAVTEATADLSPEARLQVAMEVHLITSLENRSMFATMLTELRSMTPDRRAEVLHRREDYELVLTEMIECDQAAGRLRNDISPHLMTLSLLNLMNWSIFWYRPEGSHSAQELAWVLGRQFLEGARPRPD